MRRLIVAAVAVSVLVACGSGDGGTSAGDDAGTSERLPDVDIEALEGGDVESLADLEGPAVINLWATWCAPCRREIPDFEEVHLARGDDVRFVGINIGEDADRAAAFVAEIGATYDQYRDPEGYVVTELRTTAMPVTIVIDADGEVTTRHLGPMDVSDLDEAIDLASAG